MPSPMPAPTFIKYVSNLLNKLGKEKKEQDEVLEKSQENFLNKPKDNIKIQSCRNNGLW